MTITYHTASTATGDKVHTAVKIDGHGAVLQCGTAYSYRFTISEPLELETVAAHLTCTKCADRTARVLARSAV